MRASDAKNNVKKARAAKKREVSNSNRKIKKSQKEAYEEGLKDADGHLKKIYKAISTASSDGKTVIDIGQTGCVGVKPASRWRAKTLATITCAV